MRRLKLRRKAANRIEGGHVWAYRGETEEELAVDQLESALVCDDRGRLLGSALIDARSPVPVRLYSRKQEEFDENLIASRLEQALQWRRQVVAPDSTGYRLVFSESDALPGLIVDRFGRALAIQATMRNYSTFIPAITQRIAEEFGPECSIDCAVCEQGGERSSILGSFETSRATYLMNGLQFEADLVGGPKTGAFLDQRENYSALSRWIEKAGVRGRGLDLYSSMGGFALHLARSMEQVDAVDSAEAAVRSIANNADRNGIENIRPIEADVKQFLRGLGQARKRYECVVADPPAFAKSAAQKAEAARAYYDLNLRALGATASKGLFVTCSCSRAISEAELLEIVRQSAAESRRTLTILEKRGQSLDHREVAHIPETSYLKCLIFRLDQ